MTLKRLWGIVAVFVIAAATPPTPADARSKPPEQAASAPAPATSAPPRAVILPIGGASAAKPAASTPAPAASAASAPAPVASALAAAKKEDKSSPADTYMVRRGDTLSGVFGREGGKAVCELNKLVLKSNCNVISVGQKLDLPDGVKAKARASKKAAKAPVKAKAEELKAKNEEKARRPDLKAGRAVTPKTNVRGEIPYRDVGRAPLMGCGKKDVMVINEEAWKVLGLSQEDRVYLRLNADHGGPRINITPEEGLVRIPRGERIELVTFCRKGRAVAVGPMRTAWSADTAVYGQRFVLPSGRAVVWMRNCGNWIPWHAPTVKAPPIVVQPPPAYVVPPPAPEPSPQPVVGEPAPLSVIPKGAADAIKWEAIVGVGVWGNNIAEGNWQYGEGMILLPLKDGYEVGAGVYAQGGSGESKTSAYSWSEKGFGPQVGVKRNYLTTQTDKFGQQSLMPAGWGVKLRFLKDSVSGGNPESGYSMSQTGRKIGLYAEYMERKSPDWMVGVNGEIWNFGSGKITSTWSGDTPQDRGSWNMNAWAQYRHSDVWQTRGVVGVAHQNWDKLNWLRVAGELRYKETFMCGPSLALALNKPAAYASVSKSDLTTLGFSCRAEFGGIIRTLDREKREASVVYVGPVEPQGP